MDLRWSSQGSWAWLVLGAAALSVALAAPPAEAPWHSEEYAEANEIPGAHSSKRGIFIWAEGHEIGQCPNPCTDCKPVCPTPVCPTPVCPPLPPIPPCPQPVVNFTCPMHSTNSSVCPPPPTQSPVRKPRPPGYEGWPTAPVGIYKLYRNKTSWLDANNTCFKEGAHLVILNTREELNVIMNMMEEEEISYLNIGFHDNYQEGHYLSVLGNPLDSEQKKMWAPGQPQGTTKENCAVLQRDLIHDYPCTAQFPFVCEVPY